MFFSEEKKLMCICYFIIHCKITTLFHSENLLSWIYYTEKSKKNVFKLINIESITQQTSLIQPKPPLKGLEKKKKRLSSFSGITSQKLKLLGVFKRFQKRVYSEI